MSISNRETNRISTGARFAHSCGTCATAFEGDPAVCPRCGAQQPRSGWVPTEASGDPWLGRLFDGRYRLRSRIGQGTSGVVYRATRRHLDQQFAVKIIDLQNRWLEVAGDDPRERVEREVRVLSTISSPHVVSFHDLVELPDRTVAVVMDYAGGRTLRDFVRSEGALEVERAVQIALEVASGLRQAHRRGAVHRDLKPENVMLEELGAGRVLAEVIDFGIVASVDDGPDAEGFVGTPRFTSPEQARNQKPDIRSDVYTLGAVLFFMLTGRPPFERNNARALLIAHAREETPSPSESSPEREFPRRLETLVLSMMAKDPGDRPATMSRVMERLERIRSQQSGLASPLETAPPPGATPVSPASDAAASSPGAVATDQNGSRAVSTDQGGGSTRLGTGSTHPTGADADRPGAYSSGPSRAVTSSEDGCLVAVGYPSGRVRYGPQEGRDWSSLEPGAPVTAVAIDAEQPTIAVGRADATTEIFHPSSTEFAPSVTIEHDRAPRDAEISPDGYLVAVEIEKECVQLFSTLDGHPMGEKIRTTLESFEMFES